MATIFVFKAFVSVMGVDGIETNVCYKKKYYYSVMNYWKFVQSLNLME